MSGIDLPDGRRIRKGASDAIIKLRREQQGRRAGRTQEAGRIASPPRARPRWSWPTDGLVVGVVVLEDILKPNMSERFERLRKMGLRTVMITGDNPLTAATIAKQAGVDDFLAQATPGDQARLHPQGAGRAESWWP